MVLLEVSKGVSVDAVGCWEGKEEEDLVKSLFRGGWPEGSSSSSSEESSIRNPPCRLGLGRDVPSWAGLGRLELGGEDVGGN